MRQQASRQWSSGKSLNSKRLTLLAPLIMLPISKTLNFCLAQGIFRDLEWFAWLGLSYFPPQYGIMSRAQIQNVKFNRNIICQISLFNLQ